MSDSQFGVLIATLATFLSGLIGMLKWSVGRITKALDDNTASNAADSEAKIKLASELAVFSTKLDSISSWVREHTPPMGNLLVDPENPDPPARQFPRPKTVPGGGGYHYGSERAKKP